MERQLRRLFTYVVYQSEVFGPEEVEALKAELGRNPRVYYEGFKRGINELCRLGVEHLVGEADAEVCPILEDVVDVRNTAFPGQLTDRCLLR